MSGKTPHPNPLPLGEGGKRVQTGLISDADDSLLAETGCFGTLNAFMNALNASWGYGVRCA